MPIVQEVILGSSSPFREKILKTSGLHFVCKKAPCDEKEIQDKDIRKLSLLRSLAKANALVPLHDAALIIGADQTLSLEGRSLEKVESAAAARECLYQLSGREYVLHSGFCLVYSGQYGKNHYTCHQEIVDIAMKLRPLSKAEIEAYVNTGEWKGVVGCNRIEAKGIYLHDQNYHYDTNAIQGLPLGPLLAALRGLGIDGLLQEKPPWPLS